MNQVCEFIKDYIKSDSLESDRKYIHLNFNEDYSTLIEEKGNIIKYLNKIEEVLDITFLNEGKFDIYIKNNMIVKLNIDMYIDSRLHDYWEIDVEKIIK